MSDAGVKNPGVANDLQDQFDQQVADQVATIEGLDETRKDLKGRDSPRDDPPKPPPLTVASSKPLMLTPLRTSSSRSYKRRWQPQVPHLLDDAFRGG
ncbi:hypothetical protein [Halococcus salsus]|uniref:hypothetical protein n=1 Tax=Halococcus salsus TaxID=2162894 RepID=UPI001F035A83|nr:hypothetical protein [Halococcus salsus]